MCGILFIQASGSAAEEAHNDISVYLSNAGGFSDIIMSSDGEALTGLWFEDTRGAAEHRLHGGEQNAAVLRETSHWLDLYFSGKAPDFTPEYRLTGLTPFRRQVVDIMNTIPFGETLTYGDIAKRIAQSSGTGRISAQAVGGAVGWNPICIIIPCHRVVGAGGDLTGYGGGIQNKIALLAHEKHHMTTCFPQK